MKVLNPDTTYFQSDSIYGTEENYEFMEENGIEAFVKYPLFHKEQTKSFKDDAFHAQNLCYNKEEDYYVCPAGQHMNNARSYGRTSSSGYVSHVTVYEAENCVGCPLRERCHCAADNRRIIVNHNLDRLKAIAQVLLKSEEGIKHRKRRSIEPESVFGQMKANMQYTRFRHFGEDLVKMDFAIFATAFNLLKLHRKQNKKGKTGPKKHGSSLVFVFLRPLRGYQARHWVEEGCFQRKLQSGRRMAA